MTAKEWRIIREYSEKHQLRPQLSHPAVGKFYFTDRDGKEVKTTMLAMKAEVESDRDTAKQTKKRRQA